MRGAIGSEAARSNLARYKAAMTRATGTPTRSSSIPTLVLVPLGKRAAKMLPPPIAIAIATARLTRYGIAHAAGSKAPSDPNCAIV